MDLVTSRRLRRAAARAAVVVGAAVAALEVAVADALDSSSRQS